MDNTIKLDVLDELIQSQTQALDALKMARGQRVDRVDELCRLVGISKRALAGGIILEHGGDISISELAQKLQVGRATIYRWPEVVRALKAH
jgi:hypothetical protein